MSNDSVSIDWLCEWLDPTRLCRADFCSLLLLLTLQLLTLLLLLNLQWVTPPSGIQPSLSLT